MFPNDDICDVNAARDAARRLFSKYKVGESGGPGMGQEDVSRLMKATYEAINMPYQPNQQDVFSFMDVFESKESGSIQLQDIEKMAVKYLCGEEIPNQEQPEESPTKNSQKAEQPQEVKKEKQMAQPARRDIQKEEIKIGVTKWDPKKNNSKPQMQIKIPETIQQSKVCAYTPVSQRPISIATFYSPKNRTLSKESSSTGAETNSPMQSIVSLLSKGRVLFDRLAEGGGIREKVAGEALSESYKLLGRCNYNPSQEDVKIWMRLCDRNSDGVVQWNDFQHFLTRTAERQGQVQKITS